MLIPTKDLQAFLDVDQDGVVGPQTISAIRSALVAAKIKSNNWSPARLVVGAEQLYLHAKHGYSGDIDGYEGPETRAAWEDWVKVDRVVPLAPAAARFIERPPKLIWPRQVDVPDFYGAVGQNQVMVDIPWTCYLTWDPSKKVKRMSLHRKVADSASRVFKAVVEAYGPNMPDALCRWSGSLNVRLMVGGSAWSMHSWGIAIDWDDDHNSLHTPKPQARLSGPEFEKWWQIWEAEGWVSLGRSRNYDWMHVQAARL